MRAAVRRGVRRAAAPTARWRMDPSYLIIGAQKAGTTSLQAYLEEHPLVCGPVKKELHYFNLHPQHPYAWYRGHFPLRHGRPADAITGEATPEYLAHPLVPERVAARLPHVKLIAVLRDPVARALSHYNHERHFGREPLDFEAALDAEPERLAGEVERVLAEPGYYSLPLRRHGYVHRGLYAEQLERWLRVFGRDQLLVLQSERLFTDPEAVYARVLDFLGLPAHRPQAFGAYNARTYPALDEHLRERLRSAFADPNERLFALIGERFDW